MSSQVRPTITKVKNHSLGESSEVTYDSPAKINLGLLVYPINQTNYHPLYSIFQKVSIIDKLTIRFRPATQPSLTITGEGISFPTDQSNILYKVFNFFKSKILYEITVHIDKNIPLGAGLGGASSNAATFIQFLITHCHVIVSNKEKALIAKQIGADVPFFLYDQSTAILSGIGDKIAPYKADYNHYYILIYPNIHCDTVNVYRKFDSLNLEAPTKFMTQSLRLNGVGENMLQEAAFKCYPKLKEIYDKCKALLSEKIHMTGSGSTLYLMKKTQQDALKIQTKLMQSDLDLWVRVCRNYV